MSELDEAWRELGFESLRWAEEDIVGNATPLITPGPLSTAEFVDRDGLPVVSRLIPGVHWSPDSYPAWSGLETPQSAQYPPSLSSMSTKFEQTFSKQCSDKMTDEVEIQPVAPFNTEYIARAIDRIRLVLGFQFDSSKNVLELLMSQLDSRASRTSPNAALKSLHADYIGGRQSNFRKWYFAAEMDTLDRREKGLATAKERLTLGEAEAIWDFGMGTITNEKRLEEVIIYLLCWTEANQVRYMPECLAFIVKCAKECYYSRKQMPEFVTGSMESPEFSDGYFLDHVITPLYNCYRAHNFSQAANGGWMRKEGDHKNFIGYDDMNQFFWSMKALKSIKIQSTQKPEKVLVDLPQEQWYETLGTVDWSSTFVKTYRESRSWFHILTNFSRIWIIHAATFWFYTAFNSPSLYTPGYNYMKPVPPQPFVKWTIMSLGGLIGPIITFIALLGELRFVPRGVPGAKPVWPRLVSVGVTLLVLGVPAVCNLTLNSWSNSINDYDRMPATVAAGVLFALAILYTLYFSFQPLGSIFGSMGGGSTRKEADQVKRRFLANSYFTARFAELSRNDRLVSWTMCMMVFTAKLLESYFFLTLSVRDPIRELSVMSLVDTCAGDAFVIGPFLCNHFPKIILVATILTDMALFFLDTYLWYVIFNTLISVCMSVSSGTSIWTPWRNVYSRLPGRISSKLLFSSSVQAPPRRSYSMALRIIWSSIVEGLYDSNLVTREQAMRLTRIDVATKEPSFFTVNEDGSVFSASEAAFRRISFFAQSLSTPMQPVSAIKEMPSFTVMIPHYKEKIILSLRELMTTDEDSKVTTLEFLRRLYPAEWENFLKKELQRRVTLSPSVSQRCSSQSTINSDLRQECVSRVGFCSWDPNHTTPPRIWASERAQTLYRTVRGFYNYSHAIKVLAYAETEIGESDDSSDVDDLSEQVSDLVKRKFQMIVAMQLYSTLKPDELDEVETLFRDFPNISVSFVQHDEATGEYFSCVVDSSCQLLESGKRQPRIKIRLSGDPYLGDGKSDNQNNALIFYRGEYIQLIDSNQDNYLEECLKIRNVLMEFDQGNTVSPKYTSPASKVKLDLEANLGVFGEDDRETETPVAIVGAREYIFSENIGILGDVAAGKEQTFGTLFSRTLARVGAKLHYGHPDILNAIFMTTRGGVSKGQRGLHLNEDIYAGMTAVLRGGRIRHSEYFQCGKGRDLGFVSILNFTTKIGAGMGEQMLSREYFYMGTQLPFDRFISFYYAHPGFHLNNVFIVLSLEMLLSVTLWFASIASVSTKCRYDRKASETEPHRPAGCQNVLPLLDWTRRCVVSIFLVFFISLCPLFFQEFTEKGLSRSIKRILKHLCSLSMLFEIFVCRIYARSFWEDLNVGGAKYVATGRGFATARVPFSKLYSGYRPEILVGFKAIGVLVFSSICLWHPSYLWFWVTTFSLCMCPFLYNPHQFGVVEFFNDYRTLLQWFFSAMTREPSTDGIERNTWGDMARNDRNKLTGVKRRTKSSESVKPSFKNAVLAQFVGGWTLMFTLMVPYVFVCTQKTSKYQTEPNKSALLQILLVSAIPLAVNISLNTVFFAVSLVLYAVKLRGAGNIIAGLCRIGYISSLVASWWLLYIVQRRQFVRTLLGIMTAASIHHLLSNTVVVFLLRRQRSAKCTNDPWWSGNWGAAKLGWKMPLIMIEESIVKTVESLQFSYDFLACHFILIIQIPFLLIPYFDKVHCLFLLWLPPSICSDMSKGISVQRYIQKRRAAIIFGVLFTLVESVLITLLTLPLYLPSQAHIWLLSTVSQILPAQLLS